MGEIIYLAERAADLTRPSRGPAVFFFALECPLSYLAAERVERALGPIEWAPVIGPIGEHGGPGHEAELGRERLAAERFKLAQPLAVRLGLPLVEPDRFPMESRRASRVAVLAARHDCVHRYALAISRLAFCGGYDVDDPDTIAEAASCAGLSVRSALTAARNPLLDRQIDATTRGLVRRGVGSVPAIRIGSSWFEGADPLLSLDAWPEHKQPPA